VGRSLVFQKKKKGFWLFAVVVPTACAGLCWLEIVEKGLQLGGVCGVKDWDLWQIKFSTKPCFSLLPLIVLSILSQSIFNEADTYI